MKATLLVLVLAVMAIGVFAQDTYTPAIMTKPADNLKKPIIFAPKPAAGSADADAPLTGAAPAGLVKAVVTANLYGGAIEFKKGRDANGCPCKKQLPEKFRYDTQFRAAAKAAPASKCGCAPKPAPKPEDALPPVIAQLRAEPKKVAAPAPCAKKVAAPAAPSVAPEYYPKKAKVAAPAPCAKPVAAAAPAKITPEFYPVRKTAKAKTSKAARARSA